jgi:hypothetical protein
MKSMLILLLAFLCIFGGDSFAVEGSLNRPAHSPQQTELLELLSTLRPSWLAFEGTWMLDEWDTDAGLEKLVIFPTKQGNAAEHFQRLEALYAEEKDETNIIGDSSGILELLRAAEVAECRLSPDHYPLYESADSRQPDFLVLRSYLQDLLDSAVKQEEEYGNIGEADRRYQAALLCGRHLTNDKSTTVVYLTGLLFKLRGAQAYELFLRRQSRSTEAKLMREYISRTGELIRLFHWKANSALGTLEDFASLPVSVEIALRDKEKCWRADAVTRLAIFRHGAPDTDMKELTRSTVWESVAEKALEQVVSDDPNPSIRKLAAWAIINISPNYFSTLPQQFQ